MAKNIIAMPPVEAECPHCKCPLFVDYQIAEYEGGDSYQFLGLRERATAGALREKTYNPKCKRERVSFTVKSKAREGEPKPKRKRVSFIARR